MGRTRTSGLQFIDLSGKRFGRLLVVDRGPDAKSHPLVQWNTRCDCGKRKLVNGKNLRRKVTTSCGCYGLERATEAKTIKDRGVAVVYSLWSRMRVKAIKRGFQWSIPRTQFAEVISRPCFYCGCPPKNRTKLAPGVCVYSGLDRIDSALGYVVGNVLPCCFNCNVAKNVMSIGDFHAWIKRVYEHQRLGQ